MLISLQPVQPVQPAAQMPPTTGWAVEVGSLARRTWASPAGFRTKLWTARSRLYQSEILQENMRLKALAEIYTMHPFAPL